jgi:hypothetical protein
MNDLKKSDLKMSSLNVRTTYHIYYFTFKLYFFVIHGIFFLDRFMMVVRKNVLEYIITFVVVKNKVRLKKCLNFFQI